MSLPPELWSRILSNLTYLEDICESNYVCKLFNELIPKSIRVIESYDKIFVFETIRKYVNLTECSLELADVTESQLKLMLPLKKFNVGITQESFNKLYIPYWLKRTRDEFNSITHTFTFAPRNMRESRSRSNSMNYVFGFHKGYIYSTHYSTDFFRLIQPLVSNFDIILDIDWYNVETATRYISGKFGVRLYGWNQKMNFFQILTKYPCINYIEIFHSCYAPVPTHSLILSYLEDLLVCEREVTIKLSIPVDHMSESIYNRFPNAKLCTTF